MAAYREQTVEITLGPKGAFGNGNVGTLTCLRAGDARPHRQARRVAADLPRYDLSWSSA